MKPVGKRLILSPVKEKQSKFIDMPDYTTNRGIVLAIPEKTTFKIGQEVIFAPSRVNKITVSDEEFYIILEKDIEGIYEG